MDFSHFIYALLNILNQMSPYILLGFILAGMLHVFIRPDMMSRHLAGHGWRPVVKAALLGIPLPLCSCGVLPTAVALRRQGASKGASTSFLIATPQTGVDSIAATYALLGLPFAIVRPIAALVGSVAGGMAVDRSDKDRENGMPESGSVAVCTDGCCNPDTKDEAPRGFLNKMWAAVKYGLTDMVASVGKWLVIGLVVAAVITVAVPDSLFLSLAEYPLLAMLVMVAVAVPMYVCATGSIPIAMSLMLKGLTPGVGFVLLMAGPAANFASVMVLRKSLGRRATWVYVLSVVVTAILFGLLIDYLLPAQWFALGGSAVATAHCHAEWPWFPTLCSALLVALLIRAFVASAAERRRFRKESNHNSNTDTTTMQKVYKVKGIACAHCKATVEKAVGAVAGVNSVAVDLPTGRVSVDGAYDPKAVADAVANAGFDFLGEA